MIRRQPALTLFPYTTLFRSGLARAQRHPRRDRRRRGHTGRFRRHDGGHRRSEEHTSELQSHSDLVCRLLLEKKKERTEVRKTGKLKITIEMGTDRAFCAAVL